MRISYCMTIWSTQTRLRVSPVMLQKVPYSGCLSCYNSFNLPELGSANNVMEDCILGDLVDVKLYVRFSYIMWMGSINVTCAGLVACS